MAQIVLLIHAAATWYMVGLIWFVQIVHYPLFDAVGTDGWCAYSARHTARTTWVVLPAMLLELITTLALAAGAGGARVPAGLAYAGAGLLAVVWVSTFALQVPRHRRLGAAHSRRTIRTLVATNWVRTVAWTVRGVIALAMLVPPSPTDG